MNWNESHRITKLLEDENEQDEVFWNQDALKDVGCIPLAAGFLLYLYLHLT